MHFEVHLGNKSKRYLKGSDEELCNRITTKLKKLADDPFPQDAKRVKGQKRKIFRLRVGDYRILYVVFLEKNAILVVNIDKRARAYKR